MWVIHTVELFRSDRKVKSNLCSSICFIRSKILGILGILGLPICVNLELFILSINLDVVSSFNVFSTLIFLFRCNVLLF